MLNLMLLLVLLLRQCLQKKTCVAHEWNDRTLKHSCEILLTKQSLFY